MPFKSFLSLQSYSSFRIAPRSLQCLTSIVELCEVDEDLFEVYLNDVLPFDASATK